MSSASLAIEQNVPPVGWKPLLRAASLTGSGAVAGAALTVVATKIFATMLGPSEVAVLATLQQIRQAGVIGTTLNGQTALVQGMSARSGQERREFLRTVMLLMGLAASLVMLVALVAPGWIAALTGLGAGRSEMVRWLIVPLAFSTVLIFLSAVLNARGDIGRLSLVQMASPAAMAVLAYPIARTVERGQEGALVTWLALSACFAVAVGLGLSNRQELASWFQGDGRWWSRAAARGFVAVSGSMLASGAVASIVLLAARARILHQQGFVVGGQFDAAWAISMNHVSLVLGSLQTYCLPALARTPGRAERNAHLTRMLTAAALAAAATVCVLVLLKPLLVAVLYSGKFSEAARFLRWTLVGDYLKASSWVLSIPMLAAADMRVFLAADLSAYAIFALGATVLGQYRGAAEGTAIAFVLMYAAHLAICGVLAWRRYGFRPTRRVTLVWAVGLVAVVGVSAATWRVA